MVNAGKKLFDVAFEHPASAGVILAHLVSKAAKTVKRFVRPLAQTARERVGNKGLVVKGVKNAIDGAVEQAVAESCFVDLARLGVIDPKMDVAAVTVS